MIGLKNILIFIIVSIILIRLFFYIGNLYGYLMITLILLLIPVVYIIKKYFLENNELDYMVYYQQDYVNNLY